MNVFNKLKISNIILIMIYYILMPIKGVFTGKFLDMKKLTLFDSSYFVILDTGLYLYELNGLKFFIIFEFNNELKETQKAINIAELYDEYNAYIFCLVNEYLFIFNEYTKNIYYRKINEIEEFINYYYNILPYKAENKNISFLIVFNNDTNNLYFYFYNFKVDEDINKPILVKFSGMNIQNKMIRCQINSNLTFIYCFYYSKDNKQNILTTTIFYVKDMNLIRNKTYIIFETNKDINQIKVAKSYNDNFFLCFSNYKTPICFINDYLYNFNKIDCDHYNEWNSGYKVLYFKETDDFMLISKTYLVSTIFNNANNSIKECNNGNMFSMQASAYSLIYNNGYQPINFETFSNYIKFNNLTNISIQENNNPSECIEEIKDIIYNLQNKEELIENLNELIKNKINKNYIEENNEIIITKEEMTISFTSTYIQQMNINKNSTTINLGQCERDLKNAYNISEKSNLYILKIDKEQKGRNYPVIEYEVFYPLNNGKMEILNLSFYENSNIEIYIPIKINGTIDKYNLKSNYYNDICSKTTSESNIDIPLNDRKNEFIKNNMSLCEDNCELSGYDKENKKAKCSCAVKTSLTLDNNEINSKNLLENFIDIKAIANIEIIKCYKIVFDINNLKNNYGSFIIISIFILFIFCIIIFYCKSLNNLINEINKIIKAIYYNRNQITKNEPIYSNKRKNTKKTTKRTSTKNLKTHDWNSEKSKIKNKSLKKKKNIANK